LEQASLKVFTLNFEPGTLNGCYPINVLNEAERLERLERASVLLVALTNA
jgi:hypothetical protein